MRTQALIIGGGATGTGLARDLALRGVPSLVVEKGDINSGASGRNHGLLHSGARYVATDRETARECHQENQILKKVAPHCIEDASGLFVAVEGDDETYAADFPHLCHRCGIPCQALSPEEARDREPALSDKVICAYLVDDAAIDPFKLSLENIAEAKELGAHLLCHTKVIGFERGKHRIKAVHLINVTTGKEMVVEAEQIVNAAGAWAAQVASLAGLSIEMLYSKGTLLVTGHRITGHIVNRLRKPGDGDILVPGGSVSILGTTSIRIDAPDNITPSVEEVDLIVDEGAAMIPELGNTRYIRSYAGVRPLLKGNAGQDDRSVSRGFMLLDHTGDGLDNFVTVPSGKLTTYRFMAEKTGDVVCKRLGNSNACRTQTDPLPSTDAGQWTTPLLGAKLWLGKKGSEDHPLCECEMLPKSLVDSVIDGMLKQGQAPDLVNISLRSRVGKGICQGTFCTRRVAAHLYDRGILSGNEGLEEIRAFLRERWRGERPVLWDAQLIQAELKEAIYCGLSGLEQSS